MLNEKGESPKIQWRKNLYSNVGYEDNYTDVTFLEQLRTNINHQPVSFKEAFLGAALVTEQLCIVAIFIVLYLCLLDEILLPNTIFLFSSLVTILCYVLYLQSISGKSTGVLSLHSKTVAIFFMLGSTLSPVLKTLTDTISTDTINATTIFMMLLHLIFFDYKVSAAIVSNALSTNAAIFGSLCLASRLPSSFHAFVLLTVSVECFVLYAPFAYSIRKGLTLSMFFLLALSTFSFLLAISPEMSVLFALIVLFLNLLCPVLFVRWQGCKNNIYGPWDEAVISDVEKD